LLGAFLVAHTLDLGGFARMFVRPAPADDFPPAFQKTIDAEIGDARTASDDPAYYERYDDAGIFDSILLANPYRALLRLAGLPADFNEQRVDASSYPLPALQAAGVRFVITPEERPDLERVLKSDDENLYRVNSPVPHVSLSEGDLRDGTSASYVRGSSDEIDVRASMAAPGFVHVLESFDPGWSATVDGAAAPVVLDNGFAMAVPIQQGEHTVRLIYRTPGRRLGCLFSLASITLFLGLLAIVHKKENPA
jgi:Bacterial membrane protein YfhO